MLATHRLLPGRLPDVIAVLVSAVACALCVLIATGTAHGVVPYWFGGWVPRAGQPIGIAFLAAPLGAWIAAFIALLFTATLLFSWGFFAEVGAHYHVLMLVFMAGMLGFCFTHDLFNLFVWFEVMSVAGFALTGYALSSSALAGALNFTVVNTIGAYLILGGIGLVYAQAGALDFSGIARAVSASPDSPVLVAGFVLLASGLLIKGAQVPFHFWLADAHAVAPSPVSVIFSGAMVSITVYGVAKLVWSVFPAASGVQHLAHVMLLGMGAASALVGGVMCLIQRHIKRLLAFSTISHVGVMLIGVAVTERSATAGMALYLVGHGLLKAALFMLAGILLATLGGIDEIGLRGRGRRIWPAGLAFAAGGLLLAGLPLGLMDAGLKYIGAELRAEHRLLVRLCILVGNVCTGAAVLRITGRVFLGLGPVAGEEERSPTEEEHEKANRPLWAMLAPAILLLVLCLLGVHDAERIAWAAVGPLVSPDDAGLLGLSPLSPAPVPPWHEPGRTLIPAVSVILAIALAALDLFWEHLPRATVGLYERTLLPVLDALRWVHGGLVGDYVTWVVIGLALFGIVAVL
ncbi:MAG: NADH-quinone oxidoreductase subunit E [Gluconacetobacter diazotrophicus]|nr:NADH-quinone oxidoreductase subunit E [Gluconacetobacter diazotrophicus]